MAIIDEFKLLEELNTLIQTKGWEPTKYRWMDFLESISPQKPQVIRIVRPTSFVLHDDFSYLINAFSKSVTVGINNNMLWSEFNKLKINPQELEEIHKVHLYALNQSNVYYADDRKRVGVLSGLSCKSRGFKVLQP